MRFRCTKCGAWFDDGAEASPSSPVPAVSTGSGTAVAASAGPKPPAKAAVAVVEDSKGPPRLAPASMDSKSPARCPKSGCGGALVPLTDRLANRAATRIQRAFRTARAVRGTLFSERESARDLAEEQKRDGRFGPVAAQRRAQLAGVDPSYLGGLYGLRVIASMTHHVDEPDFLIANPSSTSYLRDAYDKVYGPLSGCKKLIMEALAKARSGGDVKAPASPGTTLWLVNSPLAVHRLEPLRLWEPPLLAEPPTCREVEPGLCVLTYKLSSAKYVKPWHTEAGPTPAADIFSEYIKFIGAIPSSYQMYRYVHGKGAPLVDAGLTNDKTLDALLRSADFTKVKRLGLSSDPARERAMAPVYRTIAKLIAGLKDHSNRPEFIRGRLVESALQSITSLVNVLALYDCHAERCRRAYDLILDELFLILGAVRPFPADALVALEAETLARRIPSWSHAEVKGSADGKESVGSAATASSAVQTVIQPAWSGMDALTTALEAAAVQSGTGLQVIGEGRQTTYWEVGCVLAAQMKLYQQSMDEELEKKVSSAEYPCVLMATMNPSTPFVAGPTAKVIADVVTARAKRCGSKTISLVVDATLQPSASVSPAHQLDDLVRLLQPLVLEGRVQILLARSYQKYQSLGSGKFMGGAVALLASKKLTESARYLAGLDSTGYRRLEEMQLFMHILRYAADEERAMTDAAARGASLVSRALMPNVPNKDAKAHVDGLPFALKIDMGAWAHRLALAHLDSFGQVVSSYLEITSEMALRLNPGQESRERLIEKFFAAGHLWHEDYRGGIPFKNVAAQVHAVLAQVAERADAKSGAEREALPFILSNDPPAGALLPPDRVTALYRLRPAGARATDSRSRAGLLSLVHLPLPEVPLRQRGGRRGGGGAAPLRTSRAPVPGAALPRPLRERPPPPREPRDARGAGRAVAPAPPRPERRRVRRSPRRPGHRRGGQEGRERADRPHRRSGHQDGDPVRRLRALARAEEAPQGGRPDRRPDPARARRIPRPFPREQDGPDGLPPVDPPPRRALRRRQARAQAPARGPEPPDPRPHEARERLAGRPRHGGDGQVRRDPRRDGGRVVEAGGPARQRARSPCQARDREDRARAR
ncbi:MAG: hypothetical protein QM820_36810 [Minicystis sp.]